MYYSDRFPTEHCPQICTLQQRMHVAFPPPEIWDLEAKMELNWNQFRTLVLNESTAVWYCTGMWSRKTSWLVCLALPIRRSFTWWSVNGIMRMIVLIVRVMKPKTNYDMKENSFSTQISKASQVDFGLATPFKDTHGQHVPCIKQNFLTGTPRWTNNSEQKKFRLSHSTKIHNLGSKARLTPWQSCTLVI